ncbi:MAG TPA: MFS transporter [Candidatus Mediterraneibacter cottocaccae]|nr:MFS transporter [Candidatus Mediterraneibacter cottocaccae]
MKNKNQGVLAKIFSNRIFDSKVTSANTQKSEMWLGYFAGPCLVYLVYYAVAGSYLTQFYTDVLGLSGVFLTFMPLFSKIFDAFTNVVMGRIIDRTRTKQGKARPWILISGICMAVTGILLYTVPRSSYGVQIAWIIVSYNLFFAFAFTIYNMSHCLMVPLSTRNTKQRDGLAMLTSTGTTMLPGLMVTIILPIMINAFGVGEDSQGTWIMMMSIISIFMLPATIIEYYFTKERVTEETITESGDNREDVSMLRQLKACCNDPYWLVIMGFTLVYQIFNFLSTNSMLYYCNWVLADSVDGGTALQVAVNAIGQAPLGLGVFALWPIVKKIGKRKVMMFGFGIGAIGSLIVLLASGNFILVLIGLFIKSIGALPTYVMMAMLAEALDHIEWQNGFRADGFSASVNTIIITVSAGIGQSIILGGISAFGYIAPTSNVEVITQPDAMKTFFAWCFVGIPMIGYVIGSLLMLVYDVEDKMPQITADITARHKAEAEARGEVYISPEEKAAIEQEELEKKAEEKRIEELKEKCAKKGLDFQEEERKYQEKLAAQRAKEEAKAKKKKKK